MSDIKHRWLVQLRSSNFRYNQGQPVARVIHPRSYTLDDVLAHVSADKSIALEPENVRHAVNLFLNKVEEMLLEGSTVNLPIGRLTPAVAGTWQSGDRQDPNVRALNPATVNYALGPRLKKQLAGVQMEVHSYASPGLRIYSATDQASGTDNERLTPGGVLILKGNLLGMDGDLPERGVYLTRVDDGGAEAETLHLRPDTFYVCTKRRIILPLPATLAPGQYRISVVSQCTTGARPRKTAAEYLWPGTLRVEGVKNEK